MLLSLLLVKEGIPTEHLHARRMMQVLNNAYCLLSVFLVDVVLAPEKFKVLFGRQCWSDNLSFKWQLLGLLDAILQLLL